MSAANVEVRTVERAIRCKTGHVHYGPEYLKGDDPARVLAIADAHGCGPHSLSVRERIVTEWTDTTP